MKRLSFFKFILTIASVYQQYNLIAQETMQDVLRQKFEIFSQQSLPEKLFVHIDRDFYLTGELMWFKIYDVEGSTHRPLLMSSVAYVEILDKNNQPVIQAKIAMSMGFGNGSLFLPVYITSGNYQIRAYTEWMKNYSPDFYFHKAISIVNPFIKLEKATEIPSRKVETQFFPEGGNLVAGVSNKVAFRVSDAAGKGLDFSGALVDQRNDTVLRFSPLKFGIGNFSFVPSAEGVYRAVIRTKDHDVLLAEVPHVQANGYALRLEEVNDQIKIQVSHASNEDLSGEPVCLFVHARQVVSNAVIGFLERGSTSFFVDKKDLAEGISHITIFSKDLRPVCERLYFRMPSLLSLQVQSDQQQYGKRSKVSLNIQTDSEANLSVAVVRLDSLTTPSVNHIAGYLWLRSDLKGEIESPEYYYGPDSSVRQARDNLMLTHGWRRFSWDSVLSNRPSILFAPENGGHIIHGTITDKNGAPAKNVMGYVAVPGKIVNFYGSLSNEKGEVFFEMKRFLGTQHLIIQTNTKLDSTLHFEIKDPFSKQFSSMQLPAFHLSTDLEKPILSRSIGMQVQDIYSKNEIDHFAKLSSDSLSFYGIPDEKYYLDAYTRFTVMEDVMREYVPGVMVRKRKDGFHFMVLNSVYHKVAGVFRETPLMLLDGVPIFDENEIMNFDPLKVKKLEVVTRKYFYGPMVLSGIVSFTTYQGDLGGFQINPKSVSLNYDGLELLREFYSPNYESQTDRQKRLPDYRSLLYWNPSVIIDRAGQQKVEFYTSDLPGNYQVVVEGISSKGLAGGTSFTFSVR